MFQIYSAPRKTGSLLYMEKTVVFYTFSLILKAKKKNHSHWMSPYLEGPTNEKNMALHISVIMMHSKWLITYCICTDHLALTSCTNPFLRAEQWNIQDMGSLSPTYFDDAGRSVNIWPHPRILDILLLLFSFRTRYLLSAFTPIPGEPFNTNVQIMLSSL